MLTLAKIKEAENNLASHILETPLVYSDYLSQQTERSVFLKLESQQYTSSFKARPAFNSILKNLDQARGKGVIAFSSGNFGQAVAYASKKLGVSATIIMTTAASAYKKDRIKSYDANIIECGTLPEERIATTQRVLDETKAVLLHPFDTDETMAGDATVATEVLKKFKEDFSIICCTSGGGLTAGIAFATKEINPHCEVYGSLPHTHLWPEKYKPNTNSSKKTIADALVPAKVGENVYPIIQKYVDGIAVVSNEEIREAMRGICFEQRLIVEPGGAASVAALLSKKFLNIKHKNVICVITGANIEFLRFKDLVETS